MSGVRFRGRELESGGTEGRDLMLGAAFLRRKACDVLEVSTRCASPEMLFSPFFFTDSA